MRGNVLILINISIFDYPHIRRTQRGITMTDKEQIIIDGVDVSECNFLGEEGICNSDSYFCEGHTYCYFKQLQKSIVRIKDLEERIINHSKTVEEYCDKLARKTQECENLKEDYKELEQRHNGAFQDFKRLKQEHEELKKYLKEIGVNLGLNVDTGIIGEGAFEHWVVVSSSINYAIENLQQECEQKQNIIEEIEEYCKKCQILDLFGLASSEKILDIINKKARKEE